MAVRDLGMSLSTAWLWFLYVVARLPLRFSLIIAYDIATSSSPSRFRRLLVRSRRKERLGGTQRGMSLASFSLCFWYPKRRH